VWVSIVMPVIRNTRDMILFPKATYMGYLMD